MAYVQPLAILIHVWFFVWAYRTLAAADFGVPRAGDAVE